MFLRMPRFRAGSLRTRLLLILLAAVSIAALFTTRVSRKMPDFEVYWTAGSRAAEAQPLYRVEDGHYQFKYLPAFAVLAVPLASLPLGAAKALWFGCSAILITVLLALSARAIPAPRLPLVLLLVITFIAMAKFYAHELVLGQVNLLFAVLVMLAVLQLRRGRAAAAGLLLAAAVIIKPYAVLFAPWLAVRSPRVGFATMIAALVAALIVPAVIYGWHDNVRLLGEWWRTARTSTAPNLTNQDNVSLAAMFHRWLGDQPAASTFAALTGLLLLGLTAVVVAGRGALPASETLEAALLLILIPLLSPQGWDYVFLIATPGVMLLVDKLPALPRGLRIATALAIAAAGLSIYDVMGRSAYAAFMATSAITICFLIEASALITLRFRRAA
jgi:Glycosyltransferase family 87